jgi:serine phosphatase RsbU (regulator of sigma subunit)/Tfp pilus assembly protein PilF
LKIYNLKILLITILSFLGTQIAFGQKFADKEYYLVDSLVLEELPENDRQLIDSLLNIYHNSDNDTLRLLQLNILVSDCEDEIWVKYNQILMDKSIALIDKNKNNLLITKISKKYLASSYNNLGYYYFSLDDISKATTNFKKAIVISQEINKRDVISIALNNLGYIYKQQGDILKALDYYHQSLKLNKELKEDEDIALALNNIGGIYFNQKEYDKSLKYYIDALLLEKKGGTKKGIARLYSNIGSVYKEQNKIAAAIDYFDQSIKIYTEIGHKRGLATSLSKKVSLELNSINLNTSNKDSLLKTILLKNKEVFNIYNEINDNEGMAYSLCNISLTYKAMGDLENARKYAQNSIDIAQEIGFPESIKKAAKILKDVAVLKNDYKNAFLMQELFYSMQDSINSQSIKEATIQKQYQYEYEKKAITDSLASAEIQKIKDLKYDQEIQQQKTYTFAGIMGLILMVIVVMVTFRGYQIKKKSNVVLEEKNILIEEKNIEITDSITYAKRIQQAILPPFKELSSSLKNCFVFYKPKDIVAGDFYWLQTVGDTVLYAAADCTGHGVPGAMVSVVCHNALNRAVKEYKLIEPAAILEKTTELVIETFKKSEGNKNIRDGMDIALCSINFNTKQLQYSGANNPLYIIREGGLIETKGNKQPVGNYYKKEPFINHTVKLNENDVIYTFSDGYADQFGGPKGKKFMYKQFKELLISINDLSMSEQHNKIEKVFNQWKGDTFQIDDVCVIGVKI